MSDNTLLNVGTGGDTIATNDIAGVKHQLVKVEFGASGSATQVSGTNPLPTAPYPGGTAASASNPLPVQLSQGGAVLSGTNPVFARLSDGTNVVTLEQPSSDADGTTDWLVPVLNYGRVFNGTTWDRQRGDATAGAWVNIKNAAATPGAVQLSQGNAVLSSTNPLFTNLSVASAAASLSNPVPAQLSLGNAVLAANNPLPVQLSQAGSTLTAANPIYSQPSIGGAVVSNSNPIPVELVNSARTDLRFYAVAAAAGATTVETAISLTKSSGTSATSSAASFVITNGKRFRMTHISFATRGNATATVQTTTFNLRINTGGAVTTSSTPIILSARSATPATASAWDRYVVTLPADGIELLGDGTMQFGVTAAATFTTNAPTWDVCIIGYEY